MTSKKGASLFMRVAKARDHQFRRFLLVIIICLMVVNFATICILHPQHNHLIPRVFVTSSNETTGVLSGIGIDQNQNEVERIEVRHNPHEQLPWSLPQVPTIRQTSEMFMHQLAASKHKHNISLKWEESSDDWPKLPTPIFILNLPKSGTQTMTQFFSCDNVPSSHTYIGLTRTGDCLRDNFMANLRSNTNTTVDPLQGCHEAVVNLNDNFAKNGNKSTTIVFMTYSDIGTPGPEQCFYSSINDGGLQHLYDYYPNSTIMLITREAESWYKSISKWEDGRLLTQWKNKCGFHGSIGDYSREDWVNFYHAHTEKIRQFASTHLTMTYVEMELENPSMIEYYTGIGLGCFQHCHPGKKTEEACKPIDWSEKVSNKNRH